jgi:hypothetical protein
VTNCTYVITVRGVAGPSVRANFDDVDITVLDGTTVLRSVDTDQAALYGLIQRAQDLGLEIINVQQEATTPA